MSMFGPSVAQSVAGLNQAERSAAAKLREGERKRPRDVKGKKPGEPGSDEVVLEAQAIEAARSIKSNDQEEAREDHVEHAWYLSDGRGRSDGESKLDLEA